MSKPIPNRSGIPFVTVRHDRGDETVTSFDYFPSGQMRSLSRAGFERQYAYTADGQRIVTRDPGTGRLTVTLRGLDTKVRRVVERQGPSGPWTWVKDYVTRGGLQVGSVDNAGDVQHFYLDHLGSIRQIATGAGHHAAFHTYFPFGEAAPPITHDGEAMKFTGHERDFNDDSLTATMHHLDYMHARDFNGAAGQPPRAEGLPFLGPRAAAPACSRVRSTRGHEDEKPQRRLRGAKRLANPNLARFLTIDPGRDNDPSQPQSWNLYAYTRGNPMKYVDPTGRWIEIVAGGDSRQVQEYLVSTAMRPSGRAVLESMAVDEGFRVRFSDSAINAPAQIAISLRTRNPFACVFGRATGLGPDGAWTGVDIELDTRAISMAGHDKTGVTTTAHELYHGRDFQAGKSLALVKAGDVPSSETGPAERFGRSVSAEGLELTREEAQRLVRQWLEQGLTIRDTRGSEAPN